MNDIISLILSHSISGVIAGRVPTSLVLFRSQSFFQVGGIRVNDYKNMELTISDNKLDFEYRFTDLFDLDEIQNLQDKFAAATGVASIITEIDGTPITKPSNFCDFCINVVRSTELGLKNCMKSDAIIGSANKGGPTVHRCFSGGLIDGGVSILIGEKHIANWLVGQILDKEYNQDEIMAYIDKIGADRDAALKALNKVTRMSIDQFASVIDFLFITARQLSTLAIKNLEQAKEIRQRKHFENEAIRLNGELKNISYHDQLTGIHNRRFYEEQLNVLDTYENLPISLILGDINGLKLTNDAFGHMAGDKLIKLAADCIKNECREEDILARIGGDEFILVLPKTDSVKAEKIVNRIVSTINSQVFKNVILSVSFGWATKYTETESISKTFMQAEDFMYRNKLFESSSVKNQTIKLIIKSLHERYNYEQHHAEHVSKLCKQIAQAYGLSADEVSKAEVAGLLHDIGKIGIEEKIIKKAGTLNDDEWSEVKRHSEIGYQILSSVNEFSQTAESVLAHHERWDGTGYPKGLKGVEIPIASRIIAIAEAFDAMKCDQSYRKALLSGEILAELGNNAGRQFDPEIVHIFINKVLDRSVQ